MKILVYGAGVVGSFLAARLHEAGNDVALLARGARLEELRKHGIVLEPVNMYERSRTDVEVVESLEPDAAYDLILVVVRCGQVSDILPVLAANRRTPTVAFLGNNAGGADELVAALGADRVLLGFPAVGGVCEGHVVRYMAATHGDQGRTHLGELDGSDSSRLQRIAQAFERTSVPVVVERDIDGWLKTHAAMVVPLAHAIYLANGDTYRLARTRDGVVLAIRAVRELFAGLRERGIAITPARCRVLEWIPEPLLVSLVRNALDTRRAEVSLAGHANAARDEMSALAEQLKAFVGDETPLAAFDHLFSFNDPEAPPMVDGRRAIKLHWRGVLVTAGAVASALMILRRFQGS